MQPAPDRAVIAQATPPFFFAAYPTSVVTMDLRPATPADLPAISAIYAHHVRTGLASFETEPPSVLELTRRFEAITDGGYPYLVAHAEGGVVGYAYANVYRTRPAYRFTVEDSIYIAPQAVGRGIGRALLARLVSECEARGYRQMLAVIGDCANLASIVVHQRCGFTQKCVLDAVGFKFGRWVDSVLMQRPLGAGGDHLPEAARAQ